MTFFFGLDFVWFFKVFRGTILYVLKPTNFILLIQFWKVIKINRKKLNKSHFVQLHAAFRMDKDEQSRQGKYSDNTLRFPLAV